MRYLVTALAMVFVFSCASKDKKATSDAADNMESSAKAAAKEAMKKGGEAVESATTSASDVSCSSGQDTRRISNQSTEGGGCEVHYEKNGSSNVVATAKSDVDHCGKVIERIKANLERAGFTCQ